MKTLSNLSYLPNPPPPNPKALSPVATVSTILHAYTAANHTLAHVTCYFCEGYDRKNLHLNKNFHTHLQNEHDIGHYALYTVKAFQNECRIMLPYTVHCPFEPCTERYQDPTGGGLGSHIQWDHETANVMMERHMSDGHYFWWNINTQDGKSSHLISPSF
jgi:hypothetical protein